MYSLQSSGQSRSDWKNYRQYLPSSMENIYNSDEYGSHIVHTGRTIEERGVAIFLLDTNDVVQCFNRNRKIHLQKRYTYLDGFRVDVDNPFDEYFLFVYRFRDEEANATVPGGSCEMYVKQMSGYYPDRSMHVHTFNSTSIKVSIIPDPGDREDRAASIDCANNEFG